MMTAHDRDALLCETKEAMVAAFLTKPIKQSLLFDTIVEVLGDKTRAAIAAKAPHPGLAPGGYPHLAGKRLLLVEDNPVNRDLASAILTDEGLLVETADNGRTALEAVFAKNFQAVLMDVQMPEMDGYQASLAIREREHRLGLPPVPIIAMTAHAMKGDREKCLSAGMSDYVTKPIDTGKLFAALEKWLEPPTADTTVADLAVLHPRPANGADHLPAVLEGIDLEKGLARLGGNRKLYRQLLLEFADQTSQLTTRLHEALAKEDISTARQTLHSIKGMAGNLSAQSIFTAAKELEDEFNLDGNDIDYWERLEHFEEEAAKLVKVVATLATAPLAARARVTADPAQVRAELQRLAQRLEDADLEAEECWERLKAHLDPDRCALEIAALDRDMSEFNFDSASEVLSRLATTLAAIDKEESHD